MTGNHRLNRAERLAVRECDLRAGPSCRRMAGLSLVELLISLAITALLLTATMVAIDASFKAYAAAVETASTQTTSRMVVSRVLTMIRTSTAHGPMEPNPAGDPPVILTDQNMLESEFIELIDQRGNLVRIEYRPDEQQLWASITPPGGQTVSQPLLGGVTYCRFHLHRRLDENFNGELTWVLVRGSIDMTVEASDDATLAIEGDRLPPMRVVATTMPRKLN